MDVMEQMMALDMGEISVVDRASVAGSLDGTPPSSIVFCS
jgi:hypothetical protein